ncbi:MAG: chaperone modulator CbpM [Pseudomonadota bacterium]|jgi:chaperone modulatory protein CbpM
MTSPFEWDWLDPRKVVNLAELSLSSGMSAVDLGELVDYGALIPLESAQPGPVFSAECARPLSKACRLRADFHLDIFTVVLLLGYLTRIEVLERQARNRFSVVH